MAGELWREQIQIGKEVTAGTGVAATRKAYADSISLTRTREAVPHKFATGTRDRTRAQTLRSVQAGGSIQIPMSADELLEWLCAGIQATPTPTTPAGGTLTRLWTFKPSTSLDSITIERDDGARIRRLLGCRVNSIHIQGSAGGDNMVTFDLFGTDLVDLGSLTGSLSSRLPTFMEGWEANLYIEDFAGTPGTTLVGGMINWDVTINNNLGRFYSAANTLGANRVTFGDIDIAAKVLVDASAAVAPAEYAKFDAETYRIARLEFGQNEIIEGALKRFVTIDLPGGWSAVDLNQSDSNVRAYEFSMNGVYEPTLAAALQIRCQNDRASVF